MSAPAINDTASPSLTNKEKRRTTARTADEIIAMLAELFPAAFVAERWQPHKPLKLGTKATFSDFGRLPTSA